MRIRTMKQEDVEMVTELRMALLSELGEISSEEGVEPLRRVTRLLLSREGLLDRVAIPEDGETLRVDDHLGSG